MNEFANSLHGETLHLALVAVLVVCSILATVVGILLKWAVERNFKASDLTTETINEHTDRLASHDRQIRDTRAAVGEARTKLGLPSFPYTE